MLQKEGPEKADTVIPGRKSRGSSVFPERNGNVKERAALRPSGERAARSYSVYTGKSVADQDTLFACDPGIVL